MEAIIGICAFGATAAIWRLTWRWLKDRRSSSADRHRYAVLNDTRRRTVRRAFQRVEARTARAGFRSRIKTEPYAAYTEAVHARFSSCPGLA